VDKTNIYLDPRQRLQQLRCLLHFQYGLTQLSAPVKYDTSVQKSLEISIGISKDLGYENVYALRKNLIQVGIEIVVSSNR